MIRIDGQDTEAFERLYTKSGHGLWRVVSICRVPSVIIRNVLTGEEDTFGITGLTAQVYREIDGVKYDLTRNTVRKEG